jgi:hypothetical protein
MKRLLILALTVIALGSVWGLAAQEERTATPTIDPEFKLCPKPLKQTVITLTPPPLSAATLNLPDFPTTSCSNGFETNFGGTQGDRCFRHTFRWKVPKGCRCFSGYLTIQYSANQSANNDTIAFYSGGAVIPGTSMALYSGSSTVGQVLTKTIPLNCAWLANNRLSFLVQDDTKVISATLKLQYCCSQCPPGQNEMTFPGTEIKYCCEGKPGAPSFCCKAQKPAPTAAGNPPN